VLTFDVPLDLPRFLVTSVAAGAGGSMSFGDTLKLLLCPETERLSCVRLLESPDCKQFSLADSIWFVASSPTGEKSVLRNTRLFTG
jgi:hypothetical protein